MIGIDTNILVRYLTQDDPLQSKTVNQFVERIIDRDEKLYVNLIVICEFVWVLEECYHFSKEEIVDAIQLICNVHIIEIEKRENVIQALQEFQKQTADFSDCLMGRFNKHSKCSYTVSFDKRACKLETFHTVQFYK